MKDILRRLFAKTFNLCINNKTMLNTIGAINSRWPFLVTVYVGYGATPAYISAYAGNNPKFLAKYKWSPFFAGLIIQNKKIGLKTFISATESDFNNPENRHKLQSLAQRAEHIKKTLNAKQKTFAGILPGLLFRHRIIRKMHETDVVVQAVVRAIDTTLTTEKLPPNTPLILLGGRGFIGRRVAKELADRSLFPVDNPDNEGLSSSWPKQLKGQAAMLINVSRHHALKHYLPHLWPELILLNEVYPEPDHSEIQAYLSQGGSMYHLAGIKGRSLPSFPLAYSDCIPCSAAYPDSELDVVIKCLGKPAKT